MYKRQIPLSAFSLYTIISIGQEGFSSLISQVIQLPEGELASLYTFTICITAPIILLYSSFIGVLFGLLYNWILERSEKEWGGLFAIVLAAVMSFVLALTVNLPVPKSELSIFALATSPIYAVSLFLLHRRFKLKFDPAWLSCLGMVEKDIVLLLKKRKLKLSELVRISNMKKEGLIKVMSKLEEMGYVEVDYENRYNCLLYTSPSPRD